MINVTLVRSPQGRPKFFQCSLSPGSNDQSTATLQWTFIQEMAVQAAMTHTKYWTVDLRGLTAWIHILDVYDIKYNWACTRTYIHRTCPELSASSFSSADILCKKLAKCCYRFHEGQAIKSKLKIILHLVFSNFSKRFWFQWYWKDEVSISCLCFPIGNKGN